jgi:hypothetical protein
MPTPQLAPAVTSEDEIRRIVRSELERAGDGVSRKAMITASKGPLDWAHPPRKSANGTMRFRDISDYLVEAVDAS